MIFKTLSAARITLLLLRPLLIAIAIGGGMWAAFFWVLANGSLLSALGFLAAMIVLAAFALYFAGMALEYCEQTPHVVLA